MTPGFAGSRRRVARAQVGLHRQPGAHHADRAELECAVLRGPVPREGLPSACRSPPTTLSMCGSDPATTRAQPSPTTTRSCSTATTRRNLRRGVGEQRRRSRSAVHSALRVCRRPFRSRPGQARAGGSEQQLHLFDAVGNDGEDDPLAGHDRSSAPGRDAKTLPRQRFHGVVRPFVSYS